MAKRQKRGGNGQGPAKKRPRAKARRKRATDEDGPDRQERIGLACKYFCEGNLPSTIKKKIEPPLRLEVELTESWGPEAELPAREAATRDHAALVGTLPDRNLFR